MRSVPLAQGSTGRDVGPLGLPHAVWAMGRTVTVRPAVSIALASPRSVDLVRLGRASSLFVPPSAPHPHCLLPQMQAQGLVAASPYGSRGAGTHLPLRHCAAMSILWA